MQKVSKVACEYCGRTLSSKASLLSHHENNQQCISIQKQKFKIVTSQESENVSPSTSVALPRGDIKHKNASTLGSDAPIVVPYLLGVTQTLASYLGGRDGEGDSIISFLESEIGEFNNNAFDRSAIENVKSELKLWMQAYQHHVNAVWQGVSEEGVFNPARGRGGNTPEQQSIVAAYMVAKWKKLRIMNPRIRSYKMKHLARYAKYERLTDEFKLPQGSLLQSVYGAVSWPRNAEYKLSTVEDYALMNAWFMWKACMAKQTILKRLMHPFPLAEVKDVPKDYQEVLLWLSKSPQGV